MPENLHKIPDAIHSPSRHAAQIVPLAIGPPQIAGGSTYASKLDGCPKRFYNNFGHSKERTLTNCTSFTHLA